jgi:hypothetical protein
MHVARLLPGQDRRFREKDHAFKILNYKIFILKILPAIWRGENAHAIDSKYFAKNDGGGEGARVQTGRIPDKTDGGRFLTR